MQLQRICHNLNLDFHIFARNWVAKNIKRLGKHCTFIKFCFRLVVSFIWAFNRRVPDVHLTHTLRHQREGFLNAHLAKLCETKLYICQKWYKRQIVRTMFLQMSNGFAKVNKFSVTTSTGCLFVWLSVCLFVCLSVCLFIYLSVGLFLSLFVCRLYAFGWYGATWHTYKTCKFRF